MQNIGDLENELAASSTVQKIFSFSGNFSITTLFCSAIFSIQECARGLKVIKRMLIVFTF